MSINRDPLYELELARALYASASNRPTSKPELLRGLEAEIDWWKRRAIKACKGEVVQS